MALADAFRGLKILTLDIETSPTLTYTFSMKPKWISPEKIEEPSRVLCVGYRWYGKKTELLAEFDFQKRRTSEEKRLGMIHQIWELMDEADAIVTFNGDNFDLKRLKSAFVEAGLTPPSPYKSIDLFKFARKQWQFESSSLNHLAQRLGVGEKFTHSGFELWRGVLQEDFASWQEMKTYCMQDVTLTEQLYDRMRGWMPSHPHLVPCTDTLVCNQCGSSDLIRQPKRYRARQIEYGMYACQSCGAFVRAAWEARVASTVGIS